MNVMHAFLTNNMSTKLKKSVLIDLHVYWRREDIIDLILMNIPSGVMKCTLLIRKYWHNMCSPGMWKEEDMA